MPVVKTPEEAQATARRASVAQRGFLGNGALAATTAALGVVVVAPPWALVPLAVLALDFMVFLRRRAAYLRHCRSLPLLSDALAAEADREFAAQNRPMPSMTDYEVAAGISERPWANDLRYAFAVSQYRGGTIVDIGCGDGRLCWRYGICEPEKYIGVDPARDLISELANKTEGRARGIVATAEATTLPDESVDLVICSECFEHLAEPGRALREFARILRPGGRIVIQSPSAYQMRNLNPLHILSTFVGRWLPGILQRTVVHENTFMNVSTYHWDFTRQDLHWYMSGLPLEIVLWRTATYRFNPAGSPLHRLAYRVARWPLIDGLWWDMTIVLRNCRADSRADARPGWIGGAAGSSSASAAGRVMEG